MNKSSNLVGALAALAGALFGVGLVVSGMTDTAKVLGFLNVAVLRNGISWTAQAGLWDPSLALVMGAALAVTVPGFGGLSRLSPRPWLVDAFHKPTSTSIDGRLLLGSALFGLGWGLVGYCPGPALASLAMGGPDVWLFAAAMLTSMWATQKIVQRNTP